MRIQSIAILILLCCMVSCGKKGDDSQEAQPVDTVAMVKQNLFPKLVYPDRWIFAEEDASSIGNEYPGMGVHYVSFDSTFKRFGSPDFFRELTFKNGKEVSGKGYGSIPELGYILSEIDSTSIILFHWSSKPDLDPLIEHRELDLYFMNDGDSLRVFYGRTTSPGNIPLSF